MEFRHATVMRDEVARMLAPSPSKTIVDATLGGGGHAEACLEGGARVVGFDRDPAAIASSRARLARFGDRLTIVEAPFAEVTERLAALGFSRVDGVVADLGVSSPQFDDPARGFSFQAEGPLDMRMGGTGETAAELVERLDEEALASLIFTLGDESFSRRIARAVKRGSPRTTTELADLVAGAIPRKAWPARIHPATKTFQALRIAVNDELGQLDTLLARLPTLLAPGGRSAIISFHSHEDRRVKEAFRTMAGRCTCPPGLPMCVCQTPRTSKPFRLLTQKAIVATAAEAERNPRARSAKLRAIERLP